jgi:hypothetical protein
MKLFQMVLSYDCHNQAQFNTAFVQQEKVDRVGFEPTKLELTAYSSGTPAE